MRFLRACFALAILAVASGLPAATLQSWAAGTAAPALPAAQTNPVPPLPPPIKSPVEVFRELLSMSPGERVQALTNRPPELKKQILAKVAEYEALSPNQRELRLEATELRWYLWPLMHNAPTNRMADLASVPEKFRALVAERLQDWDSLPAEVQNEIQNKEAVIRFFTELASTTNEQRDRMLAGLTPARREQLEAGVEQWQNMTETQRQRALRQFNRFFELTTEQKQRALSTVSEPERRKIEQALQSFARLNPVERAHCIRALGKFAGLSVQERQQFLTNAERWKKMPPDERQALTKLVNSLANRPPLPPGLDSVPLPPMPRKPPTPLTIATNTGG